MACALATYLLIGVTLGVIVGYARGPDRLGVSRAGDLLMSLPALIILLVVFAVFPDSLVAPMAILGVIGSAGLIRVLRSVTLGIREDLYIRAARVFGLSHGRIVLRHVLPRISGTVIVQASLFAGVALVIEAGLAFLGFGVVLPKPSWGGLLGEASEVALRSPWLLVPAGGVIGVTVLAVVLFGNAVRDTLTERWAPSQLSAGPATPATAVPAARQAGADRPAGPTAYPEDVVLAVEHLSVEFRPGPRRGR